MKVTLVATTQPRIVNTAEDRPLTPDELLVYIARVSNPANQHNHLTGAKLLDYCLRKGHVSIFEQAGFTVEIETSRAISAQILRHRSFCFQEFSQRYAEVQSVEPIELRTQDPKNRQASGEVFDPEIPHWWGAINGDATASAVVQDSIKTAERAYGRLLDAGVSKETARMILPMASTTRLYMTGNCRSWMHYLQSRCAPETQKEHREVALEVRKVFCDVFPSVALALGWLNPEAGA